MHEDPNTLVFSRPTPWADRMAFGVCGAGALAPLLYFWAQNDFAIPDLQRYGYATLGLLAAWIIGALSMLAIAIWGGTITVTIDRKARQLSEVATLGPFTAINKSVAFSDLGTPLLYAEAPRSFVVEVPSRSASA